MRMNSRHILIPGFRRRPRILWLDLGGLGHLVSPPGPHEQWQDHGLGLLRTLLHQHGIETGIDSLRAHTSWKGLRRSMRGRDLLLMNVRGHTFGDARHAARLFKEMNPDGTVIVGGVNASVAPGAMADVEWFDRICRGSGENLVRDLVSDPAAFPRVVEGSPAGSMDDWPWIDRTLWPRAGHSAADLSTTWPLEPGCGWGPPPVATMLTSRACPWRCAFCNESAYLPSMGRRSVASVIEELNRLDQEHGPIGSVVFHDSMFFQHPRWLEEWCEAYPRKARRTWPYWAAARSDLVRRWPDLFEALVRETNWNTISIGFESGSDRMLRLLNKECTVEDHLFAIDLLNRIGDAFEARGREPPRFWANIILGIPGERREEAFRTMALLQRMRHVAATPSFYAPYPGTALGFQIIAEGKSRMHEDSAHRFAVGEPVAGIDYRFYRELLDGRYEKEIARCNPAEVERPAGPSAARQHMYLFGLRGGGKKLAWGRDPDDALDILSCRLSGEEMSRIMREDCRSMDPREIHEVAASLR
jgi:radical SAM superfamily enzyme YgiQ (UPF0313 family)